MSELLRYLFEDRGYTLLDGPDIDGLFEAFLADLTSCLSAPFQLTSGAPAPLNLPPPPAKPPPPTVSELQSAHNSALREVDLLPVSEEEKQEIRSQLELAFLRKVEQRWNR